MSRMKPDSTLQCTQLACTAGDYDNDGYCRSRRELRRTAFCFFTTKRTARSKMSRYMPACRKRKFKSNAVGLMPVGVTFIDYDHDGDLDL